MTATRPLTITAVTLAADANDGGNTTPDDFAIVSQNCSGTGNVGPLAPACSSRPTPTTAWSGCCSPNSLCLCPR
jgi:hypothetical protein